MYFIEDTKSQEKDFGSLSYVQLFCVRGIEVLKLDQQTNCLKQIILTIMKQNAINNPNYSATLSQHSTSRNCQSLQLRNIMKDVKNLQKCIQQLDILQQTQEANLVPSTPNNTIKSRTSSRNTSKGYKANNNKSHQLKQNSVRTIRKEHSITKNDSLVLKNTNDSCALTNYCLDLKKGNSGSNRCEIATLPPDYVCLQMENLKLEKQNLYLQKKLLQQELLMEREKELLKNRLKRIKTFNSSRREDERTQKQKVPKYPNVNQFQISPIKIKSPLVIDESMNRKKNKKDSNNRLASKIALTLNGTQNQEELVDSLLLSESNRSQHRQLKASYDRQGWQFIQTKQRQTLGEIANCLGSIAKKR